MELISYPMFRYLNNHTSVWGSYWKSGQWGFFCCHSLIKKSYCLGEAGKVRSAANPEAVILRQSMAANAGSDFERENTGKFFIYH